MQIEVEKLVPGFIRNDKNGYALAKAIETGMILAAGVVENGMDIILDVEKMPEWRLDEMAWELGCLYDPGADVETKRGWIRDAEPVGEHFGTKAALVSFLQTYFPDVLVEENWEYGGRYYTFRVMIGGGITQDNYNWAKWAIRYAKNLRSLLSQLAVGNRTRLGLRVESEYFTIPWNHTGDGTDCGQLPDPV